MKTKKCFKCPIGSPELPLSSFYTHKETADGHLNKCKKCTIKDATNNRNRNNKNDSTRVINNFLIKKAMK